MSEVSDYYAEIGAEGGAVSSTPKVKAARANGKKGGRPRLKNPGALAIAKRESRKRLAHKQK